MKLRTRVRSADRSLASYLGVNDASGRMFDAKTPMTKVEIKGRMSRSGVFRSSEIRSEFASSDELNLAK
jgi:hypothetical protein